MISILILEEPFRPALRLSVLELVRNPQQQVTRHPVEVGAEVSDHIQKMPETFIVTAVVETSPTSPIPASPLAVSDAIDFLEDARDQLLQITIDGEGVWRSIALEGVQHRMTATRNRVFVIQFREIRLADAINVEIPAGQPIPAADGFTDEVDGGQQSTIEGDPRSALAAVEDFATGLLGALGLPIGGG